MTGEADHGRVKARAGRGTPWDTENTADLGQRDSETGGRAGTETSRTLAGMISVEPYDPAWAQRFEDERQLLTEVLAPWLHGGVHHIGSTAIPGLAAKPILDMMAGVRDLVQARAAIEVLQSHGYTHAEHRPHEAIWFFKPQVEQWHDRTHQLHLTEPGSALWTQRLAFRDVLRSNVERLAEYQELKLRLAQENLDLAEYTARKREFVTRVLSSAGVEMR